MNDDRTQEFETLLEALGTGTLSTAQQARLSEIVEADAQCRERYLDYMMTDASLQWHFGAVQSGAERVSTEDPLPQRSRARTRWMMGLGAAACVSLAIVLVNLLDPEATDDPGPVVENPDPKPPVRTLAKGSVFKAYHEVPGWEVYAHNDARFELLPDQTIRLEEGELYASSLEEVPGDRPNLVIHTVDGDVTATGTRIYVTASREEADNFQEATDEPTDLETMNSLQPLATLTRVFIIAGMATIANDAGLAQGAAGEQLEARKGQKPAALVEDGNYKEAYEVYHKLLTDPAHGGDQGAMDLSRARDCLTRLNRISEWDDFAAQVIAVHGKDWRMLQAVAQELMRVPQYGRIIDGRFERGSRRGGRYVRTSERDRLQSLQLFNQALEQIDGEEDQKAVAQFYWSFARIVKAQNSWRLQLLTQLGSLPDYGVPVYRSNISGAPVTKDDQPLYYSVPESWKAAGSDGERWRWLLAQVAKADPAREAESRLEYASFLRTQFGVHTMGYAPRLGEDGKPEGGVYAVHTLDETETIARLATGVRRWELPAEHNFVRLLRELGNERPKEPESPIRDLSYKVYQGTWEKIPDFSKLQAVSEGTLPKGLFSIGVAEQRDKFGMVFEGRLLVEEAGDYTFEINSDDGAILTVGELTVDNDGLHSFETGNSGTVKLTKGEHAITLRYFENTEHEGLAVRWKGPQTKGQLRALSDERNIKVPAELALEALAGVYENRLQYPKAAEVWREAIEHFGPGRQGYRRKRLSQIVDNWGRFENSPGFTKGQTMALSYVFRNGEKLSLRATRIKVDLLLEDIKEYLRSNPDRIDHNKANPWYIGRRLVNDNEEKYRGELVSEWDQALTARENHWDRRVEVPVKLDDSGAYLIEGTIGDGNTTRLVVWLNDTSIVTKALNERHLYLIADANTGKAVPKASVEFFGYWSRWLRKPDGGRNRLQTDVRNFAEKSDERGFVLPDPEDLDRNYRWLVTVRDPDTGRLAIMGFDGVWAGSYQDANYQATKAYTVTNRPLYRPGAKVNFKSWVRAARYDMAWVSHFGDRTFKVQVRDPRGEIIYDKEHRTGDFGGLEGSLELGEEAALGSYRVSVIAQSVLDPFTNKLIKNRTLGSTRFRVEEYKKPEFEVTVHPPSEPSKLGETIKAKISATYYFGAPVKNASVHYKIERRAHNERWTPPRPWDWFYGSGYWWNHYRYDWYPGWRRWGCWIQPSSGWNPSEVVADNVVPIGPDGSVEIEIPTDVAKELFGNTDHKYTITAEVRDESRRTIVGKGSVIAAREPFEVYSWLNGGHFRVGDTMEASFRARTADGKPVTGTGVVTLFKVSYDAKGTPSEEEIKQWKVNPDDNGQATQKIAASAAGQYRIAYKVTDARGNTREGATLVVVRGEENDGRDFRFNDLEVVLDKSEYRPGDRVRVLINTARKDSTVALFVRPVSGIYKTPELISVSGGSVVREIELTKSDMPNVYVEAITVSGGKLHSEVRQIVVPPEKRVLTVDVTPSAKTYKPGEKGEVQVRLLDSDGNPFVGETVLTVYDKSLEYISGGLSAGDIRSYFWKWRRRHSARHGNNLGGSSGQLLKNGELGMSSIGVFGRNLADTTLNFGLGLDGERGSAKGVRFKSNKAEGFGEPASNKLAVGQSVRRGRGGQAGGGEAAPTVRTEFADSAVWVESVKTNIAGIVTIPIDMPENLTTWKIMAWGLGNGTVVGSGETEVITSKDLLIRMQAPRFFVEKDEVVLSANVHNYLPEGQDVKVSLESEGGHLALLEHGKQEQSIHLAKGGDQRVDWRVKVSGEGEATVRMLAIASGDSDAMEMRFPVYIHGALTTRSWSGVVATGEEQGEVTIDVPKERRASQSLLEIRYSPSIAMSMVDALPYLATYPHKSCESVISRFVPAVITKEILKDLKVDLAAVKAKRNNLNPQEIGDPKKRAAQWQRSNENNPVWDEAELSRLVKGALRDLATIQNQDGGFPWFQGGQSGAHTTAQTVHGLLLAKQHGVAVVPTVLDRAVTWLVNHQQEEVTKLKNAPRKVHPWKPHASNLDAYVAMVLTEAGKPHKEMNDFLYRDRTHLAVFAKALVGITFHLLEENERRDMLVRNIRQFEVRDAENQTTYLKLGNGGYWYYWYGNEVEAHACYLRLLAMVAPKDPATAGLAKYLLNNRRHGSYWHNTRDTAHSIEALAAFAKASGETEPDQTIEVLIDGKVHKEVTVTGENLFTFDNVVILSGDEVTTGKHKIQLRRKGQGPLYFNTYLSVFSLEDFIKKAGLEIKVERRYYLVDRGTTTIKAAGVGNRPVDFKAGFDKRKKLKSGDKLVSGDIVEVELILESKNDYEYLMFEDRKAAGFEPMQLRSGRTRSGSLGAYMELRDEKVSFFIRRLQRGKHSLTYRLRAEIPGKFSALPANGNGVYAPELRANSDEMKMIILDLK